MLLLWILFDLLPTNRFYHYRRFPCHQFIKNKNILTHISLEFFSFNSSKSSIYHYKVATDANEYLVNETLWKSIAKKSNFRFSFIKYFHNSWVFFDKTSMQKCTETWDRIQSQVKRFPTRQEQFVVWMRWLMAGAQVSSCMYSGPKTSLF